MEKKLIKIFATSWCGASRRAKQFFEVNMIPYEWIDIDSDQKATKYVEEVNHGYRSVPTIVFPDGTILTEPSDFQLHQKFSELGMIL